MNLPPTGEAIVTLIELQKRLHDPGLEKAIAALATVEGTRWTYRPIDMVMHCPACGLQHIDAPEIEVHRSHLCHGCGHIWRPADVPTNGVAAIKTRGQNDSPIVQPRRATLPDGWHVEIEGDTARVVAPPDGPGFTIVSQRCGSLAERLLFALAKALAS